MAQVLALFPDVLTDPDDVAYRAHACGAEMSDGKWQGWIEFIPLNGTAPIRSGRETTQPNRADTAYWATGLTTVYLEGALRRALNPLVRTIAEPDTPAFDRPAPSMEHVPTTRIFSHEAVLDPFAVFERGEGPLRSQLGALSAWHLVNIIRGYNLSDVSSGALNRLPPSALIDLIVAEVARGGD
ncbi:MAG: hypothetical protein ACRD2I_11425 [Vicinamibacterales bacterium]